MGSRGRRLRQRVGRVDHRPIQDRTHHNFGPWRDCDHVESPPLSTWTGTTTADPTAAPRTYPQPCSKPSTLTTTPASTETGAQPSQLLTNPVRFSSRLPTDMGCVAARCRCSTSSTSAPTRTRPSSASSGCAGVRFGKARRGSPPKPRSVLKDPVSSGVLGPWNGELQGACRAGPACSFAPSWSSAGLVRRVGPAVVVQRGPGLARWSGGRGPARAWSGALVRRSWSSAGLVRRVGPALSWSSAGLVRRVVAAFVVVQRGPGPARWSGRRRGPGGSGPARWSGDRI